MLQVTPDTAVINCKACPLPGGDPIGRHSLLKLSAAVVS